MQNNVTDAGNLDTKYVVIVVEPQISFGPTVADNGANVVESGNGDFAESFSSQPDLLNQALSAVSDSEYRTTVYSCEKCFKIFTDKLLFEDHENSCSEPIIRSAKNKVQLSDNNNYQVSRRLSNKSPFYLVRKNSCHSGKRERNSNKCSINQLPLILESSLAIITPRSYLCKRCFSSWESVFELHWHSVEKHNVNNAKNVQVYNNTDENDAMNICQRCLKCFLTPDELNNHLNSHKTETPFVCQLCEQELNMNCFRSRHYRKAYGKLSPARFICGFCEATFSTKRYLVQHLHLHMKEKCTLICGYCSQGFRQRSTIRSHIQNFHKPVEKSLDSLQEPVESGNPEACVETLPNNSEVEFIIEPKEMGDVSLEQKFKDVLQILLNNSDFIKVGLPQRSLTDLISEMANMVGDKSPKDTLEMENGDKLNLSEFESYLRTLIKHLVSPEILEDIRFEECSIADIVGMMYKIMYS